MTADKLAVEVAMLAMLTIDEVCDRVRRTIIREVVAAAEQVCTDAAEIWAEVKALLWRALGPFPEAREAVVRELEALPTVDGG